MSIPVIDIAPLRDGSGAQAVARELLQVSQSLGFLYVSGHGIPDPVIDGARRAAMAFFHADKDAKAQVQISDRHRGWLGPNAARMQDNVAADLKESFVWGWQDGAGHTPDDHALRGSNRWPDFHPELERHAMAWFGEADRVARHLLRGFALALKLPEDVFLRRCRQPLSRASFVHYPPQQQAADGVHFGVGPHTDFGVLTVLGQDDVGGLEVENADGEWIAAPPIEGTLVVNVADLLARWTAGRCKSTPHRVVNRSSRERLSLVMAFDPDPDTLIDAQALFSDPQPDAQPPITCGDYLEQRFARAFAYRNAG